MAPSGPAWGQTRKQEGWTSRLGDPTLFMLFQLVLSG